MIDIKIGNDLKTQVDGHGDGWIAQQVERRRREGEPACVFVTIKCSSPFVDLYLATGDCPQRGGGGGRSPNEYEEELYNLWVRFGLNNPGFTGGNLVAFFNQPTVRRCV
jgi:hypothetical protein